MKSIVDGGCSASVANTTLRKESSRLGKSTSIRTSAYVVVNESRSVNDDVAADDRCRSLAHRCSMRPIPRTVSGPAVQIDQGRKTFLKGNACLRKQLRRLDLPVADEYCSCCCKSFEETVLIFATVVDDGGSE